MNRPGGKLRLHHPMSVDQQNQPRIIRPFEAVDIADGPDTSGLLASIWALLAQISARPEKA